MKNNEEVNNSPNKKQPTIAEMKEFYEKNLNKWIDDAKICAQAIYQNSGHLPTIEEMSDGYAWLYLERTEENVKKYGQ